MRVSLRILHTADWDLGRAIEDAEKRGRERARV